MATAVETMKKFMDVLKGYSNDTTTSGIVILDNAVRAVSRFNGLQDAINAFVNDVTDTSKTADLAQRLKNTCGIVLGQENNFTTDTGAASGYNAGGPTVKDAQSIVPETGTLNDIAMPVAGSTTTHSYTGADGKTFSFKIEWPKSFTQATDRKWQTFSTYNPDAWTTEELTNQTFTSDNNNNKDTQTYTAEQFRNAIQTIVKGMNGWWATETAKLIYDTYGLDFNGKTLKVDFNFNQADLQADTGPLGKKENDTTPADVIEMSFSLPMYGVIDSVDVNGNTRIEGGGNQNYLDRTVAHEMVHALMQSTGTLKRYENNSGIVSMPEFFSEGIAELIMGLDDYDANNIDKITSLATDRNKLADAMTLAEGTGTSIRYASGYMFLRYLCQQGIEAKDVLAGIDAKGEDYADDLLLEAVSDYSPTQVAMLKAQNYMVNNSCANIENNIMQQSDLNYLLPDNESVNPILLYGANV